MQNNSYDPNAAGVLSQGSNAEKMQALRRMGTDHMKQKVLIVDDQDRKVWELVKNVPHVSKPVAVIQAILNLVFPGIGTMVMACASNESVSKTQLSIGMLQLLTSFVLVGWIWALYWSYLCVMKTFGQEGTLNQYANQQYQ